MEDIADIRDFGDGHTSPLDHTGPPPRPCLAEDPHSSASHRRAGEKAATRQPRGGGLYRATQIAVRMGVPSREPWAALSQDGRYLLRATPPLEKQACHPVIGDVPLRYRESPPQPQCIEALPVWRRGARFHASNISAGVPMRNTVGGRGDRPRCRPQ